MRTEMPRVLAPILLFFAAACATSRVPPPAPPPSPPAPPEPPPVVTATQAQPRAKESIRLTIKAVGDVQMGRAWPLERAELPEDPNLIFAKIREHLSGSDVVFGNLETVLADEGESAKCGPKSTRCYAFRVPTSYAQALKNAGFTVMSTANNHTADFGEVGRSTTTKALDEIGLLHSGPVGDVASFEAQDLKIALIGFSTGQGVHRVQEIDVARELVGELAKKHDLVIVSFHGGAEGKDATRVPEGTEMFLGEDRGDLRLFTKTLIDAGADLILGHGPHVLRGVEIYKDRLIVYSLGNFSSHKTFNITGPMGQSVILNATLAHDGTLLESSLFPVVLVEPGYPEPDPKGAGIRSIRELSELDFGAPVFDVEGRYVRAENKPES